MYSEHLSVEIHIYCNVCLKLLYCSSMGGLKLEVNSEGKYVRIMNSGDVRVRANYMYMYMYM